MQQTQTVHNGTAPVRIQAGVRQARAIGGWEEFREEGRAFLRTAAAAHDKGKRAFTPEILYNIVAMAIEKMVMAVLMRQGAMPYNHTMRDLVEAMEQHLPDAMTPELRNGLLALDHFQDICALDSFTVVAPRQEEIPAMLALAQSLEVLVNETIGKGDR